MINTQSFLAMFVRILQNFTKLFHDTFHQPVVTSYMIQISFNNLHHIIIIQFTNNMLFRSNTAIYIHFKSSMEQPIKFTLSDKAVTFSCPFLHFVHIASITFYVPFL